MKISLLLKREPFGSTLEQTLAGFFACRFGKEYKVKWFHGNPGLNSVRREGYQVWVCNLYLNSIFVPEAHKEIFRPVYQEYGRATIWWYRPLQYSYVNLATRRPFACWLAQFTIGIQPEVPEAENMLVIGGNHKLRVLNYSSKESSAILKTGFNSVYIERELITRRLANHFKLPVPELHDVSADGTWFTEKYVVGTPLNRLAAAKRISVFKESLKALRTLADNTVEEVEVGDYVTNLTEMTKSSIKKNHLLGETEKLTLFDWISETRETIYQLAGSSSDKLVTVLTHGDFQPANIIVGKNNYWLIDWEYSCRRQAGYDGLVFLLGSRFPEGLALRIKRLLTEGKLWSDPILYDWPGVGSTNLLRRRLILAIFLLEELNLHLEQNSNPCFFELDHGFKKFSNELSGALKAVKSA